MYLIRRAAPGDGADVAALVRARADWMRAGGLAAWREWADFAGVLAGRTADPAHPIWLLHAGSRLLGCTTVADTPGLGWTERERAEPAVFLQSTVTLPGHPGLGTVVAFWALDHAARRGARWVRRGVLTAGVRADGLVRYYRRQGWRVVRVAAHPERVGVHVWLLARPAAPQPDLADVVVEVGL